MNSEVFGTLPPTKLFFRCAVPSVITMIFSAIYNIADGLFVGRFIGGDALAAVNLIMPVIMMVFAFSGMIATGSSVRIAMLLGEKKREEASQVFSFSVKFILLISCIIGIVGYVFAEQFVRFLANGATEQAIAYCADYLKIYAVFSPLLPIYHATDNYLRICGREKTSMAVSIATQALNIVLDIVLIVFLGMGVRAAALTSCIGMALGSVVTLAMFSQKRLDIYYTKKNIKLSAFLRILANGSSEFFSSISMSVMSVVHNFFLLSYGGTNAVAAMSVVFYVDGIIGMASFAVCDSLQPAISYCYGAGLCKRVRAIFGRVVLGTVILSLAALVFLLFAGQFVAPIFVKPGDTELLALSITAMKMFSFSYLLGWSDMCFSSYFTAVDRPARSLLVSFFGTVVFPIGFLFLLSYFMELRGVFLMPFYSCSISGIFTFLLAFPLLFGKNKDKIKGESI